MAQLMTINLNKGDSPNLGFRLQGGVDFAAPLVIQKVNGGSPADRSGLQAGDAVIKINNTDVYSLRHKDAQDVIINAGPSFAITVQRGGSTWKPSVTPVGSVTGGGAINNVAPVTKTSLAAKPQPSVGAIGTGHNVSAKPFLNGTANGGPKLVNKQYNSPIGIYSEQSIAETLSAQSEVLSTGALGVNFKKNEKNYDATKSAVYHMLQEAEREPRDSEPDQVDFGVSSSPSGGLSGLKHVQAPENKPAPPPPSNPQLPPGQNICADCERLIVGVFVRIKDKNLHVECFKCSTCGASLKNVGYYNINNKLYCDIHAKLAAKSNAPAPNLVPVTVPPGGRAPAGAISAALASHSLPSPGPLSPKIAPLSPKTGPVSPSANITATPFQFIAHERSNGTNELDPLLLKNLTLAAAKKSNASFDDLTVINGEKYSPKGENGALRPSRVSYREFTNKANFSSAPRPFSSVTAPLSPNTYSRPLPKTPVGPPPPIVQAPAPVPAPILPPAPAPATTPGFYAKPAGGAPRDKGRSLQNIAWPPAPEDPNHLPTASPLYFPPPEVLKACEARFEQQQFESSCADSCSITFESEGRSSRRSQAEQYDQDYCDLEDYTNTIRAMEAKMSLCSSEVCDITGRRSAMECAETIAEHLQTQMLVENVMKSRPKSPPPYNPNKANGTIVPTAAPINAAPQTQGSKSESLANLTCPPTYPIPPQTEAPALPVTKPVCPPACPKSCCSENCATSPIQAPADLPRLQEYQKHEALKLKIQNAVPQKYETPMVAALTTAPVKKFSTLGSDPFSRIPQRHSTSALTEALSTAPVEPFNPVLSVFTTLEPVPLPEETVPYLPPEHPVVPVEPKPPKKEPPKPSSPFVEALKIAPDRPFTPVGAPMGVMKKQQLDPLLKDLPKPQEHISLLAALTTAPDEPIAPLVPDVVAVQKGTVEQTKQQQVIKLLEERKSSIKQPVPQPFISAMVDTFEGQPENVRSSSFPPVSIDLQQVKQGQQQQEMKLVDNQQGHVQKQAYHEERSVVGGQQQHVQVQEYHEERKNVWEEHQRIQLQEYHEEKKVVREQQKQDYHEETKVVGEQFIKGQVARQAEEIIYKKPLNLAGSLHKTQQLPQYQSTLEYDQELQLPHHKNISKLLDANTRSKIVPSSRPLLRAEPTHTRTPPPQITKPITTIQPGCHANQQNTFQPVNEAFIAPTSALPQRVPSRPLTPSMINKPPSAIPYYQQNLVAQEYLAPDVNLYDPKSPGVSRTPSPCPGGERPSSPWRPRTPLPKSPAAGPPPNPLKMHNGDAPKPTRALTPQPQPETFRREAAVQGYQKHQSNHIGDVSVSISEKGRHEHNEALMKSQSVESCGNVQVQRRKVVAEEFETTHKEKTVEIATKGHPFRNVNVPPDNGQQGIIGLHVTNPHPIVSPFLNKDVGPVAPRPVPLIPQQRPAAPAVQPQSRPAPVPPPAKFEAPVPPISAASSTSQRVKPGVLPVPSVGGGAGDRGRQAGGNVFQPRRGRGVLNAGGLVGARVPVCGACSQQVRSNNNYLETTFPTREEAGEISTKETQTVAKLNADVLDSNTQADMPYTCFCCRRDFRGPFITALGKIWCPDHFVCATTSCRRPLQDIGFVEERGQLHCEYCFERFLAPDCAKCAAKIKGDCLKAIGKNFHPECFACAYCGKLFGNSPFFLEDGLPYCEADWNEMFTTKCFACGFPVEAGDRWVEALNNNYHSQCFNCTMCKKNLEGQSFFAKGGRPFCKNHAR